ncbi:unnamed protein product, partial [Amoebophrya sp. A120]
IFDAYECLEKRGEGAFGKVMTVHYQQSRAAKSITLRTKEQLKLVEMEINLMKQLDHPNILKIYEAEKKPAIYLILELCNGGSIFERLVYHKKTLQRPMSERQSAGYCKQLLNACAYLHKFNIVHRDLKPDNLLFMTRKSDSVLKIIDFGLADYVTNIHASSSSSTTRRRQFPKAGTPHYMAPEDALSIWGGGIFPLNTCGVILCQMLSGEHPFFTPGRDTAKSSKQRILSSAPVLEEKIWKNISKKALDLVKKLLEKNPDRRLSAKEALKHPWFAEIDRQNADILAKTTSSTSSSSANNNKTTSGS